MAYRQIDHREIALQPLTQRRSKFRLEDILVDPDNPPPPAGPLTVVVGQTAEKIRAARSQGRAVILAYGAHLVKNGLGPLLGRLLDGGWITHLATNGAGTIHDWEYAYHGQSEEDVRSNVAQGCFGTWDETGRYTHLAILAGALEGMGYGESLGRFICVDGCVLPARSDLQAALMAWSREPADDPLMPARTEMLQAMARFDLPSGPLQVKHRYKDHSLTAWAYRRGVPLTVHPGIGYDIVYNHHMANGAALGRAADIDYRVFAAAVGQLEDGVFLSVGSAIMAPQVFEKALSLANNLRLQAGKAVLQPAIIVNDIARVDWDWSRGEPPRDDPAYYLRFCKTFSRLGGKMTYVGGDNRVFLHNLYYQLEQN